MTGLGLSTSATCADTWIINNYYVARLISDLIRFTDGFLILICFILGFFSFLFLNKFCTFRMILFYIVSFKFLSENK